jgi:hypothetical protein
MERKTAKRVNLGGISLGRRDGVDKMLRGTPAAFAAQLLHFSNTKRWIIAGLGPESYPSCGFVDQIWELMELAPLDARFSRAQTSTQRCSIVSRYYIFRDVTKPLEAPEHPVSRPGLWSAEDCEKLRDLILAREHNFAIIRSHFSERSDDAIRRQGMRIEDELSYQTWTQDENNTIIWHVCNGSVARFSEVLTARNASAIDKQIRYLHQMGAF